MSPELLDPESFGLNEECLTKESDRYALGMVIYEVLSGLVPFTPAKPPTIIRKVLDRERPARPQGMQGEWFTDGIWEMVELCWKHESSGRPGLNHVLGCLREVRRPPAPSSYVDGDAATVADDR